MLKIKNTKHLDTAEEVFTEFLDKFQKYAFGASHKGNTERQSPTGWGGSYSKTTF